MIESKVNYRPFIIRTKWIIASSLFAQSELSPLHYSHEVDYRLFIIRTKLELIHKNGNQKFWKSSSMFFYPFFNI